MTDEKLIEELFKAHEDAPTWQDDPVARDAAIRWHMRGFNDARAVFEKAHAPTDGERGWSTADRQAASDEAHRRFDEWAETRGQDIAGASINGFILGAEWWKSRRTVQGEPSDAPTVRLTARKGGKVQVLIDSLLAQANEHGIRVEVVYPQGEPTDAQVGAMAEEIRRRVSGWAGATGLLSGVDFRAAARAVHSAAMRAAAAVREEGQGR